MEGRKKSCYRGGAKEKLLGGKRKATGGKRKAVQDRAQEKLFYLGGENKAVGERQKSSPQGGAQEKLIGGESKREPLQ